MNKKIIYLFFVTFIILSSSSALASNCLMGISAAPVIGFNSDFNNNNTKTGLHFNLGFDALYELKCRNSRFCDYLFVEAFFDMTFASTYNFGPTQLATNGTTGNFRENLKYYSGGIGLKKYFFKHSKFMPFAGIALGATYTQMDNISFTDSLGNQLGLNVDNSSLNLDMVPSAGFSIVLSEKIVLDLSVKLHVLVPSFFNRSFFEIPVGIKYVF